MRELRYIKIGTEEYPIPIKCEEYAVKNANGETEVESRVVWANSEEDAFYIPTYREESDDVIYGMFKRKVESDPNMLDEMVELLTRLDPVRTKSENNGRKSQKSYAYTTIGTPGNGKTFMMQALGEIVHPKGAMLINCQQLREAEEIFKKVQIGVSKSSKRKCIDAYIYSTNIGEKEFSPNTVAYIKSVLGNDFCTQETRDGKRITAIDWNNTDASADVIERVCDEIIQREGINYKEENGNVGITTTNGPLIEALFDKTNPNYGRMVILDEYNRLPEDDGLLTMQAFFSEPGKDKLELEGADNKVYTIRREDIPETFLLLGTANQAIEGMGESIKRQSRPVISRQGQGIDIKLISAPTKADYISRTLKHLTGVPAYYVYKADEDGYLKNPSYLKEILEDFRTVGLSKDEIKEIPKEEMYNIKHIDRTLKVATAYGTLLYETDRLIQELAHEDTLPMEYTEYLKHEAVVDLRYIFKLLQHSKLEKPQGESGEEVAKKLM
ncbi:MAG: hypothetical protein IKW39_04595, partial [Alphaproteobacteria bacterium]|nr:hypothetical protein [Alphaproteobacteria bacterium]